MKALVIQGVQPMSFFEGEGASEGFRLLDPRLQLPGHQACGRIVDRIDKRLSDRIREEVKSLRQPFPSCVIEIDCWPAPTNDNYFGARRSRAPHPRTPPRFPRGTGSPQGGRFCIPRLRASCLALGSSARRAHVASRAVTHPLR